MPVGKGDDHAADYPGIALIGGLKGALIGAAIGGGGAVIVDQAKHR